MHSKKKYLQPSQLSMGIILMIIHAIALSSVYIIGKTLGKVISSDQIAFLYKAGVLVYTIPLMLKGGVMNKLKTKRIKLHMLRAVFSLGGSICFYRGLLHVPTIDAAAISFLEPIIALLVGVIYFKEKISTTKIALVILCLSGALFIIQPGFKNFNNSYIYLFAALIFWAMNNLSMKILGQTERTITALFYVSLFSTIFAIPIAINSSWSAFDSSYMKYVLVMTIFHMIHMICFFRALKLADMSVVMPFDYTRLFFTGIFSYLFLHERFKTSSAIGYALIALGGILLIYYETKKCRPSKASAKQFIRNQEQVEQIK